MSPSSVADWQLPPGVNRGLWDYLHNPDVASQYDAYLAASPLSAADIAFVAAQCPRPGRLLDLGCGTGRLLIEFARRGHEVVGVDLSESMLREARSRAEAARVRVSLLHANLVELDCLADHSFDQAACLFSTLGMVLGEESRRRAIGHVHRVLRPGGRFVLHVHNRGFNVWHRVGRSWLVRDAWRRLRGRSDAGDYAMPVHQGVAGLTLHLFGRREILRLLRAAGFQVVAVRPLGFGPGARLRCPWWLPGIRSHGYLIAVEKPG